MEKNRLQKTKLIFINSISLFFITVLYLRFRYTTEEHIEKYFIENKISFHLIANELLSIQENSILQDNNSNYLQAAKINVVIDSLQESLNINYIGLSFDENQMVTIHFEVDLNNYIAPFEYWYCLSGLVEFSDHDGVGLKKIDNNWGVFRDRRKRCIIIP